MTIDWTKPIETMEGRPARVIATDIKGDRSILVAALNVAGNENIYWLDSNGMCFPYREPSVCNVPPAPEVRYFNFYSDGMISNDHESREEADKNAGPDRIACVRVEFPEGRYDV